MKQVRTVVRRVSMMNDKLNEMIDEKIKRYAVECMKRHMGKCRGYALSVDEVDVTHHRRSHDKYIT